MEIVWGNPDFHKKIGKIAQCRVKSQGTKMWKSPSRDGSKESAKGKYKPWENPA